MGFKELNFSAVASLCKELDINYTIVESEIADIVFEHRKESNGSESPGLGTLIPCDTNK